eukprot:symbB.v1.2.027771.t1/scaffold2874.1/size68342/3
MNVRLERILEAQTQRVADATVEAVQAQLKHLEQRLEEMHSQLLPLRHLSASPLPGAVEVETQDAMPPSLRDAGRGLGHAAWELAPRSHVSEVENPPGRAQLSERMEQGIQTDPLQKGPEVSSPGEPKIAKPAFIKSVEVPPSIGLPKPRGSRSNAPIPLAIDASLQIIKLDPSQMSRWRRTLNQVVRHNSFEVVVMLTLVASSATLGFETHMNMQNVGEDPHVVFRIFDIFWCAAFLAELALRIIADGPHFLNSKNPEFTWNVTDTALVALSTADEVIFLADNLHISQPLEALKKAMARGLIDTFRKPDFNVAAFVRDAGHGDTSRLSQQLQDAALTLEEDLRREIANCHEELLLCASSINDLDGQLGEAHEIVGALKASVSKVRSEVLVPFQDIKWKVELLERMQEVNVLIRRVVRFLWDARKLRSQMDAPGKDFSKAAHTLHELEQLLQETGLDKVDILRAEVLWIRDVSAKVRRQSEEDLRTGVRQGNHIGLSVALQVFFNLQCLWPQLKKLLTELLEEVRQAPLPAGAGFHQALEVNLQVLVAQTQRVHALDELVQSKVDPVSHKTFQSVLEASNVNSLTQHFWAELVGVFKAKFAKVCQDRAFRAKAVSDCPKVLQTLVLAVEKLGRGKIMKAAERETLFQSAADLRNEYLGAE